MKQIFVLLLVAVFSPLAAQNTETSYTTPLTIGLRTGLASSSYWTADDPGMGNRPLNGMQAGLIVEAGWSERLGIRLEINYMPKGDIWYFRTPGEADYVLKDKFQTLEIPLMARYTLTGGPVKAYLIGGPFFAAHLSNRYYKNGEGYDYDDFTSSDLGLQLGAGATVKAGPGRAFAELRWTQGLKDLDIFRDGTTTRMRTLGLSFGYLYTVNSGR